MKPVSALKIVYFFPNITISNQIKFHLIIKTKFTSIVSISFIFRLKFGLVSWPRFLAEPVRLLCGTMDVKQWFVFTMWSLAL